MSTPALASSAASSSPAGPAPTMATCVLIAARPPPASPPLCARSRQRAISSRSRSGVSLPRRRGSSATSVANSSRTASTVSASGRVTRPAATARLQSTRAKPRCSGSVDGTQSGSSFHGATPCSMRIRLADRDEAQRRAAAPARRVDARLEHFGPAAGAAVLRSGRVEGAARAGLDGAHDPVGEVADVDQLDRLVAAHVGHQDLAAGQRAPRPVAEAAGAVARADDEPGADDQRALAERRRDDALARRLLRPVVARAVAVVFGDAVAGGERVALAHRRVRERRVGRDARDEAVAAARRERGGARAQVGRDVAADVDDGIEAPSRRAARGRLLGRRRSPRRRAGQSLRARPRLKTVRRGRARARVDDRRAEEDAAADDEQFP